MNSRGLSLVEILVAVSLMVSTILPLWGLMGSSHAQVSISADEIRASQIAIEILEQIENSGWLPDPGNMQFTLLADSRMPLGGADGFEVKIGDFPEYLELKATLDISQYPEQGEELGRVLLLNVEFSSRQSVGLDRRTYQASTFVSRL